MIMDAIHPVGVALVAAAGFLPGFLFGFLLRGLRMVKQTSVTASTDEAAMCAACVSEAAGTPDLAAEALEQAEVELIKRVGEAWVRIGSRHPDHPDVLNVRAGLEPGVFIRGEHPDA